jgi:tRNA-modifying protein YgfZ
MSTSFDPSSPAGALAVPSSLGTLLITGGERQSWLNGLITCDLGPLRPGQGAYGLCVSKVGRITSDALVIVAEDRVLLGCPPDRAAPLTAALDPYLVMEDAEQRDASAEYAWVLLHGPESERLARAAQQRGLGLAAPIDLSGLGGAALVTASGGQQAAMDFLLAEGATPGTDAMWEQLRLELGVARFGVDFDEKTYPQEASLERRAVSFQKGCYLGQEVVCRLEMRGHVHRKLVSLVLEGGEHEVPAAGAEVTVAGAGAGAGERIGAITSATFSPRLGRPVALALIKYASSAPGTELATGGRGARVVEGAPVGPGGAAAGAAAGGGAPEASGGGS